jgi:hypothetical protein
MAARLSALRASRTLPPGFFFFFFFFKDSWYSFMLEAESTPGPVRQEGLGKFKKIHLATNNFGRQSQFLHIQAVILNETG